MGFHACWEITHVFAPRKLHVPLISNWLGQCGLN